MYRCLAATLALAFTLPSAVAQIQRGFPQDAMRGQIVFGQPPQIALNGQAAQLAPGGIVRNQNNMIEMSAALVGVKAIVNYSLDPQGGIKRVWLLRPEEARVQPWPTTPLQLQTWAFDPVAQTWTKP